MASDQPLPESVSRRGFLQATSAALAATTLPGVNDTIQPVPPHRVRVTRDSMGATALQPADADAAGVLHISQTIATASGAPLGGIGTGYVDIRPDGCFYDWLIFNAGAWAGQLPQGQAGQPPFGPQSLQFLLRTATDDPKETQMRRLYLRPSENNLYSLGYVQDVQAIEYDAGFPMTGLRYIDNQLPVRVSAAAFSPFIPGDAKSSGTPGFHFVFTLENISRKAVSVSLLSLLDNPLAAGYHQRELHNSVEFAGKTTRLLMRTGAGGESKTAIGSMCLSLTEPENGPRGKTTFITGTYPQYTSAGPFKWNTPRLNYMLVDMLGRFFNTGQLPDSTASHDPAQAFTLINEQIAGLSEANAEHWLAELSKDALLGRIISDARMADPHGMATVAGKREILREIADNMTRLAGIDRAHSTWGSGALATTIELEPGETREIRFTLAWYFPHHFSKYGQDMGHNYTNWFNDALGVSKFLSGNYAAHRATTETFASTLADTSLGAPMAFAWSSHLGTAVTNTWWDKAGHYSIWEGLGCCGQSTMDVEFDASFSIVALFPELKLGQMRHMLQFQKPNGQVPHTYDGDFHHIDQNGWGRVDMNPQFVMMVLRDFLWSADRSYLQDMWPHVLKAMEFTASLDTNQGGLPNSNCGFQTYDQWGLRGSPSYICSLWIGALAAASRISAALGHPHHTAEWAAQLEKAAAAFDRLLFNGQYYSLWVEGARRDEMCMSDQISGIWFGHLIGLPTAISKAHLSAALESIWKNNFSPATGLRNASAPRGGKSLLVLENLQAGGVWSGIEFAFASFLMDHGQFERGEKLVRAVHERYLRAGMPWNHVECGSHYSRPMSSWAVLLAATGFKPDFPAETLTLAPQASGDFHAPWAVRGGFGRLARRGTSLNVACVGGTLKFRSLLVNMPAKKATIDGAAIPCTIHADGENTRLNFTTPVNLTAGRILGIV